MHSLVCVDENGHPLRPAILWPDQRSREQVERVYRVVGRERLANLTGNPLVTGFQLASWLWLREQEPLIAHQTRWLLLPKDYLRYRMTGQVGSEPSDASSTSFFDPFHRTWSQPLLSELEIDLELLPPLHASAEIAGGLLPEIAEAMGLLPGTPVAFGGSDQAAQALARGVIHPGLASCTIGTGGQWFTPLDLPSADPELRLHLFCHALPGVWHLEAAILSAGLSLQWLRDSILQGESFQSLADDASKVPAGSEGVLFAPYLAGERTPYMDAKVRAAFTGLALHHSRAHLTRAVMEGVVFAMRQGLDLMESLGGRASQVIASGGGVRHPLWLQLEADIFNRPIYQTETREAAACGAAMLAGLAIGGYASPEEAVQRVVRRSNVVIEPNLTSVEIYEHAYQSYLRLYPALKSIDQE
jgi:xylulokinase